jgi:hypothetical protein
VAWTLKVEIAFATDPMAASPTWTDVTAYVLQRDGVQVSFGRPDEFSTVQPSTLAITLNNRDGRFTPGYTSGAYYPNVKIGKRIRVTATRSAVNYIRFDGHVNEWPLTWPSNRSAYAEVRITATDRLQRLGETGELRSMLEEEILFDTPAAYYPLSEGSGATAASNIALTSQGSATILQLGTGGTLEFGSGTGPGVDGLSAVVLAFSTRVNGKYLQADLPATVGTTSAVTLECWFNTETLPTATHAPAATLTTPNTQGSLSIGLAGDSSGHLEAKYVSGALSANSFTLSSSTAYNDGLTHQAAITLARSGSTVTIRLYADGAEVNNDTFTVANLDTYSGIQIGGMDIITTFVGDEDQQVFNGTLSHAAAYSSTLSAARILAHYQAGTELVERTDERIDRIADWIALPAADRNLDTGDSTVGAQAASGRQPVEVVEEVAATEQGVVFFKDGVLTFHNRSRRYNTTPTITLSITTRQVADDLELPNDDTGLSNDVTVSRAGGGSSRAINQTSIDTYGLRRESISTAADTDQACESLANWRVTNYADPGVRVPNVTVDLARLENQAASQVALLLAASIGTRVQLAGLPSQAPASTVDLFIEGWTEIFDQKTWRIVFNTSPADDLYDVWELGTSGLSELGTTTILGY